MDEAMKLLEAAKAAYGVTDDDLMTWSVRDGEVVLVTIGAHKARYREGQTVTPLTDVQKGKRPAAVSSTRGAACDFCAGLHKNEDHYKSKATPIRS